MNQFSEHIHYTSNGGNLSMKNNRKQQKEITKKKIFTAAINLTNEKGFNNLSIKEIVKEAGVSIGTFYLYFQSKQDIISQIYYDNLNDYINQFYLTIKSGSKQHLEKIREVLNKELEFANKMGVEITTMAYIANLNLNFEKKVNHETKLLFTNILKDEINLAINNKEISDGKPDDLLLEFETLVRGILISWCFKNGSFSITDFGDAVINKYIASLSVVSN